MSTVRRDPPTINSKRRASPGQEAIAAPSTAPRARWRKASDAKKTTRKREPTTPRRSVREVVLETLAPRGRAPRGVGLGAEEGSVPRPAAVPELVEQEQGQLETAVHLFGAIDLILLLSVVLLLGVGTIMVYSSSMYNAYDYQDNVNYYLVRQLLWVAIGFTVMVVAMRVDYRRWRDVSVAGLVITILLLVLVKTKAGMEIAGAQRWLSLPGGQSIQPSEVAKLGLVIYVAHWLSTRDQRVRGSLMGLLPLALVAVTTMLLILREPDLGTTTIVALSVLSIFFVSGARLRHLALLAVGAGYGGYYVLHHLPKDSYWSARLANFLADPAKNPTSAGYHILQAWYALGSGGVSGVGLGMSVEKQFIPAPQTDSIFAILGEELGLVGTLFVLLLFVIFAYRGMKASANAPDEFGRLVAVGLTSSIFFQALINMAVITKLVPFTGVPLPFISFGGSSLAISMGAAGILLNISKFAAKEGPAAHERTRPHLRWRNRGAHLPSTPGQPIPFRRRQPTAQPPGGRGPGGKAGG